MKTVFLLGSKSDQEFTQQMVNGLKEWGIESEVIVASAHKVPRKVVDIVEGYNSIQDVIFVGVAGRSNALSGVIAANSVHPVFACPPFKDRDDMTVNIFSSLMMPSDTPVMTVLDQGNLVLAVVKIFAEKNEQLRKKMMKHIEKIRQSFD